MYEFIFIVLFVKISKVAIRVTHPDIAIVFHARSYGRFREIKSNFGRKKTHRNNQSSNFLGRSFKKGDNVRAPVQFRRERQPHHLKKDFCASPDPPISTSIVPESSDRSNKTSWFFPALRLTSRFLPQFTVSRR